MTSSAIGISALFTRFSRLQGSARDRCSSSSRGLNTLIAGRLYDLVTFGPGCLTSEEFQTCLDRKLSEYYQFLAAHLVRRYDKGFWQYHKRKLMEAGVGFDRVRLGKALFGKLIGAVLHPRAAVEKFLNRKRGAVGSAVSRGSRQRATKPVGEDERSPLIRT